MSSSCISPININNNNNNNHNISRQLSFMTGIISSYVVYYNLFTYKKKKAMKEIRSTKFNLINNCIEFANLLKSNYPKYGARGNNGENNIHMIVVGFEVINYFLINGILNSDLKEWYEYVDNYLINDIILTLNKIGSVTTFLHYRGHPRITSISQEDNRNYVGKLKLIKERYSLCKNNIVDILTMFFKKILAVDVTNIIIEYFCL